MTGIRILSRGQWVDPTHVAGGDNGQLRSLDTQGSGIVRMFSEGSSPWSASTVKTYRVGPMVYIQGLFRRSAASGTAWERNIGYVFTPFIPADIYNTSFLTNGGVSLSASGVTSSSSSIPAEVQIDRAGLVSIRASSAVTQVLINAHYESRDNALLENPLQSPEFTGPNLKAFLESSGIVEGVHYSTFTKRGSDPRVASIAIHGGSGEPGSAEAAIAFANLTGGSLYYFDISDGNYLPLHMDSNGFDDPRAVSIVRDAQRCVSFHGAADEGDVGNWSYVGGLDSEMKTAIIDRLSANGFPCRDAVAEMPQYGGNSKLNICNLGVNSGVQIEMSPELRRNLFSAGNSLRGSRGEPSALMGQYVGHIKAAVDPFLT